MIAVLWIALTPAFQATLSSGLLSAASSSGHCWVSEEESQVYADFLKGSSDARSTLVVEAKTRLNRTLVDADFANLLLATRGGGVSHQILEDFKSKNLTSCSLRRPRVRGVALLPEPEDSDGRPFENDWAGFRKRFSKNATLITFSRVGLNANRSVALLYVESGKGGLAGSGFIYILQRVNGGWAVKRSAMIWEA